MKIVKETLEEAFTDLISTSLDDKDLRISSTAAVYVVDVMSDLSGAAHQLVSEGIFLNDLVQKARTESGLIRREYLRAAGDVALFISGIFPDSLESRKTWFHLGDYIDIGQAAYSSIQTEVFDELSVKFPQVVDVLNSVSIKIDITSGDLVKYRRRRRTIDAHTARR